MNRSSAKAGNVGRWVVIPCVITALACGGTELPPPDPKNPLPPGVSANPAEFRQQIAQYPRAANSHERDRRAKCPLWCRKIRVRIAAVGRTQDINPDSAPASGVPVAHLVNLHDSRIEAFYGLRPRTQAEYYLWVDRRPGSVKARWTLLEVPVGSGQVTAAIPRGLDLCHMRPPGVKPTSDADFAEHRYDGADCGVAPDTTAVTASRASLFPIPIPSAFLKTIAALLSVEFRTEGGWIDCNTGCCT